MENSKKCPKCGSEEYIPIVYGKPSQQGIEKSQRGEIILGGCIVDANKKRKACKKCGEHY